MNRGHRLPGLGLLLVTAAGPVFSQTTTTGMVEGSVRDGSGRPVEGVKVRLVSSQVTRIATSHPEGRFRVGLLNPGEWQLTLEKPGYQTLTSRVLVVPEETTPVRFRLAEIAAATVEVSGSPTVVSLDPTSTSAGTTLNRDEIARLPVGRNMNDLIYLAPTAGFAGSGWGGTGTEYSISGASGIENQFLTDGLITTDLRFGGQGLVLVPEFIESVQVETSGFKPENNALGGVFNTVLRSGTNSFRGDAWTTWSPAHLEAKAMSNAAGFRQRAPADRYDVGFDAGGAFVKDRLFYFVGLDLDRRTDRTESNNSGLRGDDLATGTTQTVLKANAFLTPEQQLTITWIVTRRKESQPLAYPGGYGDAHMGYTREFTTRNLSLVYDRSFGADLLLSVKAGRSSRKDELRPEEPGLPQITDSYWFNGGGGGSQPELGGLSYIRGGFGGYAHEHADNRQLKADLTWIRGAHAVKAGLSHMTGRYGRQSFATGPAGDNRTYTIYADASIINTGKFGNIDPAEVTARYQALYVQDTWEAARTFRLIYGLRTERQEHWDAAGQARLRFTSLGSNLQPRLGFTWDSGGDGRSMLTGSYAVYFEQVPQQLTLRAWGNEMFASRDYVLTAYSATGIGSFDASNPVGGFDWESNTSLVAPGIRLPRRQEWSLGYEKNLPHGLTGSIHGLYRHLTDGMDDSFLYDKDGNNYAYTASGAGIGMIWNPGPSLTFVAPVGSVDKNGNPIGGRTITISDTFFPQAYNKYAAVTLGLSRRASTSFWSASYTWSHFWGNYEGIATSDRGFGAGTDANFGPGYDAWPYVGTGNLGLDRRHIFKFFGSVRFAFSSFALNVGGGWTWQSGLALSLQDDGSASAGLPPGTLGLGNPLDPGYFGGLTYDHGLVGNHGRSPSTSTANLHLDLEFLAGKVKLMPTLDIYNLFNSRTPTLIYQFATRWFTGEPDGRYGHPSEWLPGRRLEFGLRARF